MPTLFKPQLLRKERERKHLTQTELAAIVNVNQATISTIESGRSNPSLKSLTALADALGIRVGRLFKRIVR